MWKPNFLSKIKIGSQKNRLEICAPDVSHPDAVHHTYTLWSLCGYGQPHGGEQWTFCAGSNVHICKPAPNNHDEAKRMAERMAERMVGIAERMAERMAERLAGIAERVVEWQPEAG